MADRVACCDSGVGGQRMRLSIRSSKTIARDPSAERFPRRNKRAKSFTTRREGMAGQLPPGTICGLLDAASG